MEIIRLIWLIIWMLPQNLLGLVVAVCTGWRYIGAMDGAFYFAKSGGGSVSLGIFILVAEKSWAKGSRIPKHEYGHYLQSQILGFLYLIVIGIPGMLACGVITNYEKYMQFFTEKWANQLADQFFKNENFDKLPKVLPKK